MRWTPGKVSRNIEDRRGSRLGGRGIAVGGGGMLLLALVSMFLGVDLTSLAGGGGEPVPVEQGGEVVESPEERQRVLFVSTVLDSAQAMWAETLPRATGTQYRPATLVLFRDAVQSGCGAAQSAMGPFYCPLDEKMYIDLGFYDELARRFGAPGDFAQAYVLAHEIGHHVQHVLGISDQVRQAQQANAGQANALSVRLELQADCFAGVWAATVPQMIEPGDLQEGLTAAAAIGDDRLQRQAGGGVNPEGFTHGTSAQRQEWLRRGLQSGGDPNACDTFAGR